MNRLTPLRYPFIVFVVLVFIFSLVLSLKAAPVGLGSYTTTLPAGKTGPTNSDGVPVSPKVTGDFSGPVQTNDWWSSLIWQRFASNPYSENMFPHPLAVHAYNNGLGISYPTVLALNNEYHRHYLPEDIRIGLVGLNAPDTRVASYSDWAVTARWSSGSNTMNATFGHGLPFVYVTKSGGSAQISVTTGYQGVWHNSGGILGIQANGHYYAIFGPSSATWTGSNPFQSTLNGQNYFSVAVLPNNSASTLEFYRQHAYAYVTNTQVSWQYNQATANLATTYTVQTELKESGNGRVNIPLLALYRHQWLNTSAGLTSYTYGSPRGEMKVLAGNSFTTNMAFSGVLPAMPHAGTYNQSQLYTYVNDIYVNGPYIDSQDTYWGGKDAGRLAQLVWIADQVGHTTARTAFLNALKTALQDWLNADDGGTRLFYYDATWDTLIGFPESFASNSELNDHDFHYGYWVMAAATVASFDPAWATQSNWGGMVEMVIKDVANWNRSDTMFPFLRSFDAYAGHDWANGPALFAAGNNEESSSEAMNFATGVILWGAATGNTQVRDMGIYLHTNMTRAIEQYWFDVDEAVFPAGYNYETLGIVWGSGGAYGTWWTANPEEIHGINFLPFTGGSLYLGRRPDYVTRNYNFLVAQNGGTETEWRDIIWNFQALANPAAAISKFGSGNYTPEDGETKAHTYHWLHNLNALGQVDTAVTANTPTYAVFTKAGVRTYVAFNPGSTNLQVNFSDGKCLTVAPRQIGHGPGSTNCGGATATPTTGATATPTNTSTNTPTATPTTPATGNLALNRPAFSSSNENGTFPPGNAVDGNNSTRWSSAFSDPQWIYVDLGATYNINRVILNWEAAYGSAYQIQTSNNASNWTTIYSTSTGDGGVDDVTVSGSGRYIRMYGTSRGTPYGYSLWEFQVYGSSSNPTPTNTPVPTNTATPSPTSAAQQPYGGVAWPIPGRIEAENYDTGGQGIAYHDTTNGNSGGAYRSDRVDIQGTTDTGGGYNVGWIANGEWLEYTVNVASSGTYNLAARVASASTGGTLHVEVDGVNVTGAISFAATGGWQAWTTVTANNISLTAGTHIVRLAMDSSGFNVNWIEWTAVPTGDYSHGVTRLNSTQAQIWFQSHVQSAWVDVHYRVNGGGQLNYRMTHTGNGRWTQTVSGLSSGSVITYWFTYEKYGLAYDTATFSYTH